jgi:hypothetical protein
MIQDGDSKVSELAQDIDQSIQNLSAELELSEMDSNNPIMDPERGLALLRPMVATKATADEETAKKALAVIHLETGALLSKHAEEDPEDLV